MAGNGDGKVMAKVGRPTKYTPELLKKAVEYLDDYEYYGAVFPSYVGLALYLGIDKTTVYAWADDKDKQEFSHLLGTINSIQHEMLVGNGIVGEYQPTITKLMLTKHGYKDESGVSGPDNKPLIPTLSEAEVVRRAAFVLAQALKDKEDG